MGRRRYFGSSSANAIIPLPSFPLPAFSRGIWYGDSYVERGCGTTQLPLTPPNQGGKSILAQGLWGMIAAVDRRFDFDVFPNGAKPYGVTKLDGSEQGVSGTGVTTPNNPARVAYAIARNPQYVIIDIGKNDCNVGSTLVSIQAAYQSMLSQFTAAGIPQVILTQAAFRQGATPGDWSPTGAAQLELTALNTWLLSLSTQIGVFAVVNLNSFYGNQSVGNGLFLPDDLHLTTYGIAQELPLVLPTLQTLVSAAPALNPIATTNLFQQKSFLGINGSLSNGALNTGVAANLRGVATGLRIAGYTADAAVTLVSKETTFPFTPVTLTLATPGTVNWTAHGLSVNDPVVPYTDGALPTGLTNGRCVFVKQVLDPNTFTVSVNPGGSAIAFTGSQSGNQTAHIGYDVQTVTITPVNDAVKLHSFQFSQASSIAYTSLGVSPGDWIKMRVQILFDSWAGWAIDTDNDGFHQPGQFRPVQSDASSDLIWTEDNFCGYPSATPIDLECQTQIVATGSDELQGGFGPTIYYRSDLGGTGVVKFQVLSIEKITPPPLNAWGLTGATA